MIFETVLNRKKKISPWYDLLTEWIEKLEAGEMSALRVVYSAFASGDPALIRRAGAALQTQLSSMTWIFSSQWILSGSMYPEDGRSKGHALLAVSAGQRLGSPDPLHRFHAAGNKADRL